MILNPFATIRRLRYLLWSARTAIRRLRADLDCARAELRCTEGLLATRTEERDEAKRKLAAGGIARGQREHDRIMAKAEEPGMRVVRN